LVSGFGDWETHAEGRTEWGEQDGGFSQIPTFPLFENETLGTGSGGVDLQKVRENSP
jgi:hypothetical protein